MGYTLILELGVLISEWVEKCDKVDCDGAKCGLKEDKVLYQGRVFKDWQDVEMGRVQNKG